MEIIKLAVTTNSAGVGVATADEFYGHLDAIGLTYATTAGATCNAVLDVYSPDGPAQALLTINGTNTEAWYTPRWDGCSYTGSTTATGIVEIPLSGRPRLTLAYGGDTITDACVAYLYVREVPG